MMERPAIARLLRAGPWVLLFAFGASLALQKIRTFDYWWHLRTGRLIAESGAVPKVDSYTYTVAGAPWVDIHWLHQLGLHHPGDRRATGARQDLGHLAGRHVVPAACGLAHEHHAGVLRHR